MARKNKGWDRKRPTAKGRNGGKAPLVPPNLNGFQFKFSLGYVLVMLVAVALLNFFMFQNDDTVIPYSAFKDKVRSGEIKRVEMDQSYYTGYLAGRQEAGPEHPGLGSPRAARPIYKTVPGVRPRPSPPSSTRRASSTPPYPRQGNAVLSFLLNWILPLAFMLIIWRFLFRRLGNPGGNVLAFGQNKAMIVAEGDVKTRFGDVAGVDEAKEELVEVVDFLKSPKKYTDIGGKIPKGVLLVGPPGTGKTLLARAVAGEAEVPFFRMSGADFVEMFVGVGAARVRDLFKQAREKAPCIVFIDELDAIGKSRVTGAMGGNDEREQTLNQLLVEMDGFDATSGLIILAATNRPDVLDPALLRPGRFDRQVLVDRPDLIGREAILRIHAKAVKLDEGVDLSKVARGSAGFVGADLANLVNEAALLAVRAGRKKVHRGRLRRGDREDRSRPREEEPRDEPEGAADRRLPRDGPRPHGGPHPGLRPRAQGLDRAARHGRPRLYPPASDRGPLHPYQGRASSARSTSSSAGGRPRRSPSGTISTGAANDLTRATDIARRMITDYGMSERFRHVALTGAARSSFGPQAEPYMAREYSEETQKYVDDEIARIVAERYDFVLEGSARQARAPRDRIAERLLEKETLDEAEFAALMGANEDSEPRRHARGERRPVHPAHRARGGRRAGPTPRHEASASSSARRRAIWRSPSPSSSERWPRAAPLRARRSRSST